LTLSPDFIIIIADDNIGLDALDEFADIARPGVVLQHLQTFVSKLGDGVVGEGYKIAGTPAVK